MINIIIPTLLENNFYKNCIESIYKHCNTNEITSIQLSFGGTFAQNCNKAAFNSKSEWLLFLNDDIEVNNNFVYYMLETAQNLDCDVVGAYLKFPDNTIQHYGVYFRNGNMPFHPWIRQKLKNAILQGLGKPKLDDHYVPCVTGACLMIKRKLFTEIGGFDEKFVNGFEDVDLCLKVLKYGGKIGLCVKTDIIHYEKQTRGEPGKTNPHRDNFNLLLSKWNQTTVRNLINNIQQVL